MSTTTTEVRDGSAGLAAALRNETRLVHELAENEPFMRWLLSGELPLTAYTALVAQNYAIYTALESAGEAWRNDPVAGDFLFDQLLRVPSLERDLAYLLGPQWQLEARHLVLPATARYVAELESSAIERPESFIAHHYVRYLGDLSGGQIIRKNLADIYGDAGRLGANFFVFEGIEKVKPFRDQYRVQLDSCDLDTVGRARVVTDAIAAFELNRAVFADLARHIDFTPAPQPEGGGAA